MFYSLISQSANAYFSQESCSFGELISYIQKKNVLRDAQIEAIKTYLYLKIKCENKPLWKLFYEGYFNTLSFESLDEAKISTHFRDYLKTNKQALRLYDLASRLHKKHFKTYIEEHYKTLHYENIFKKLFYNVSYTDYLFFFAYGSRQDLSYGSFYILGFIFCLE